MLENDPAFTLKASYDRKREIKMFLDNLSTSVLRLCDTHKLSYQAASERCDLSSSYFVDIARGKTAPTILTLEKLCVGFDLTPNDLLIPSAIWREMSFRKPMPVTHVCCFRFLHGLTSFPVCPRCGRTMEREYQPYCDRCGQCLDWDNFSKATIILPRQIQVYEEVFLLNLQVKYSQIC